MRHTPPQLLAVHALDGHDWAPWIPDSLGVLRIIIHPGLGFPLGPMCVFAQPWDGEFYSLFVDDGVQAFGPGLRRDGAALRFGDPWSGEIDGTVWLRLMIPADESAPTLVELIGDLQGELESAVVRTVGDERPGIVVCRDELPCALTAPGITVLRLRGRCRIAEIRCASAYLGVAEGESRWLGLPLGVVGDSSVPAYLGDDPVGERAMERVRSAAPGSLAPFEGGSPFADRFVSEAAEADRVEASVVPWLLPALKEHVEHRFEGRTSWQPLPVVQGHPRATRGSMDELSALLASAADPGIARWLGVADVFDVSGNRNVVTVGGVWVLAKGDGIQALADALSDRDSVRQLMERAGQDDLLAAADAHEQTGATLAWLWTQGFATRESKLLPPDPPSVTADRPTVWTSGETDMARQPLTFTGLAPLGQVGVVRVAPSPALALHSPYEGLQGRLRPLFVGDGARITDALVNPGDDRLEYAVSQADMFGRWSDEYPVDLAGPTRPELPRPEPLVHRPFDDGPANSGDPWSPIIDVSVRVPARIPGQRPIAGVVVRMGAEERRAAASPDADVTIRILAPTIAPGGAEIVTIRTAFEGTGGEGPESVASISITDPRSVPPPPVPPVLKFAERPHAGGNATARVQLPQRADIVSYRVYVTTETRLRAFAQPHPDPSLGRDERADAWLHHPGGLDRRAFDSLTPEPIPASQHWFLHSLPGDLTEVVLYRLIPIGANGASPPFDGCPTVAVAVPNSVAPPTAELRLDRSVAPPELVLRTRAGGTRVAAYRIRLLSGPGSDPRSGVIVPTRTPMGADETRIAVPAIRPYARVRFIVEVRGESERGDPVAPGLWSAPSTPVDYLEVPSDPPDFVSAASADVTTGSLHVMFDGDARPDELVGFSVQAYQGSSAGSLRVVGGPVPLADEVPLAPPLAGTVVIVITDPLGRRGAPVTVQLMASVPDVIHLGLDEARQRLEQSELIAIVEDMVVLLDWSTAVAGSVSPPVGSLVPLGSQVLIVPTDATVVVPDVVGWSLAAGLQELEDRHLRPHEAQVALADWSTAVVGSLDPPPGQTVLLGTEIEVVPDDHP